MRFEKQDTPFTIVANEVLNRADLSYKAKGVFAYMFSKPEGWDFSADRIAKDSTDGRRSVLEGLKELDTAGLLVRIKQANGRMKVRLQYAASIEGDGTVPMFESQSAKTALRVPKVLKPHSAKIDTVSNKDKESNKDTIPAPSAGKMGNDFIDLFQRLNPSYKRLFMRKAQHEAAERLVGMHGLEQLARIIDFIVLRRGDRFCPTITTPAQLEERWAALEVYATKLKGTPKTAGRGIA